MPKHAMVIGKFYPPHGGHHLLVDAAAGGAQRVSVVVMGSQVESITLDQRVEWMRDVHAAHQNVHVVGIPCDAPVDVNDPRVWTAQVACMRAAVELVTLEPVDAVFSSEAYGPELARRMGARHISVDPARVAIPTSGTQVRADLAGGWDWLHPVVQAGLATRVVVLGAESSGTTTVSRQLVQRYRNRGGVWARTQWVREYGRDHTLTKLGRARADASAAGLPEPDMDDLVWDDLDFATIASEQTRLENAAAGSGSPLLVCDTDAFTTSVWERRYLGPEGTGSFEASTALLPPRAVYLLTDHVGVPFVQDGTRDGEHLRADMTGWFIEALTRAGHSWVLLTGTLGQRVDLAERVCDQILAHRSRLSDPLG